MEFQLYESKPVPEPSLKGVYATMVTLFGLSTALSYVWTHDAEMIEHHDVGIIMMVSSVAYVVLKFSVTSPQLMKKLL